MEKKFYGDRPLEEIPCNICDFPNYQVLYKAQYEKEKDKELVKKFRASGDELLIDQLVKCNNCGLIFINPRIKSQLIIDAYSEGADEVFVSQVNARERTFFDSLKIIEKFVVKKGKILDVGTAAGSFLAAAKKRGWEVFGCEPNKWLVNWGNKKYNLNITPGTLFEQHYKNNFFDVITLWDVIEHTPNPSSVLKKCSELLKSEGILIINYPDIGSWIARLAGRKWLFLSSVHLYYFNRNTIKKILRKNNFEILMIKPYFQKLELGYLLFRTATYSAMISSLAKKFLKPFGIEKKQVPYWLGQTFIIAKKIKN